ncbi:helix-turn-helix domain-containing protein [Pontibacillus yanchengensis]|uniref:Helix-turn-helix domain-containing protein n=2 Tax=Pontibacillus yanchengensis TaxID=462910 RepID=A0ACC7VML6_9BACI|nr:helix-turn-helix domain-containing protein [Pontibacillus yanchengensis]MYL35430.1 helix-turn-helix domain-containing protein [Pontibacillus yanchengensis]MYL55849.1 helix-turn-helix domain-containing protein [Pontibacillus yanchengensis]
MEKTLGDKVKQIRKKLNISQEALAYGICTQSEISRIEQNQITPSYNILLEITKKLGVNIHFFTDQQNILRLDYIEEVKQQLDAARRDRDYHLIKEIIRSEKDVPAFRIEANKKYLNWHRGIILYHSQNDYQNAIDILHTCLSDKDLSKLHTELDIQVLNSIGIIFRNESELSKATQYLEIGRFIAQEFLEFREKRIYLKTLYNSSKVLTDSKDHKNSIKWCQEGIKQCIRREEMFLFGEFHYQIGRNYVLINNTEKGMQHWKKSQDIFFLQERNNLGELVRKEIDSFYRYGIIK